MADCTKVPHSWYRLHASAFVVLVLTAAVLFLLNVPGQYVPYVGMPLEEEQLFGDHRIVRERLEHGWPFPYLVRDDRYFIKRPGATESRPTAIWSLSEDFVSFDAWRLVTDVLAALVLIVVVGLLAEYWRRQRHSIWQLRVSDLLGLTAIVAGAIWYVQSTLRAYEAEQSAIQDFNLYVQDYTQYRGDPVSSGVSVRSHGGPSWLRSLLGERFPKLFDRVILLDRLPPPYDPDREPDRIAAFKSLRVLDIQIAALPCRTGRAAQLNQLEAIRIQARSVFLPPGSDLDQALAANLRPLADLPHLWFIQALGDGIGDRTVNVAAGFPRLRVLRLWHTGVTAEGFAALTRSQTLEELDLAGNPVSGASLAHLRRLPRMRHLRLYMCSLAEAEFDEIAQLSGLERLSIAETKVSVENLQKLAGLRHLKVLELPLHVDPKAVINLHRRMPRLNIQVGGRPFVTAAK